MHSRSEILLENYAKVLNIEALTLLEMIKREIVPAICRYTKDLSQAAISKRDFSEHINTDVELELVTELSKLNSELVKLADTIENQLEDAKNIQDNMLLYAKFYHDSVFFNMEKARNIINKMEANTSSDYWPYPTYTELLFNV